jgi:hypothetical protein
MTRVTTESMPFLPLTGEFNLLEIVGDIVYLYVASTESS